MSSASSQCIAALMEKKAKITIWAGQQTSESRPRMEEERVMKREGVNGHGLSAELSAE